MAGRDRRRRSTALIVSLLIHTALLSALLLVAPRLRTVQTPNRATMVLGLVPEADLGIATHAAPQGEAATSQPAHNPPSPQPAAHQATSPAATALPALKPQTGPSAMAASPSANTSASTAAAAGSQDAARRALHAALACAPSNAQNLDEEAQAACRKRLSDAAIAMGDARVDTIPPEKRAYYDAVVKAYQDPAHLPGVVCAVPFGIPKGWKPSHRNPPHSLKLGPLPCYVIPPKGFLTEEADIPPADQIPKN
jgi:hypothetical protein